MTASGLTKLLCRLRLQAKQNTNECRDSCILLSKRQHRQHRLLSSSSVDQAARLIDKSFHPLWNIRSIVTLLSLQKITCEQLLRHCHATAVAGETIWKLDAFSRLLKWQDLQPAAQASDERRRANRAKSLLDGLPISIKANLAWQSQPLTAGSRILGEGSSSDRDAAVGYQAALVQQLLDECGAISIGVTNMDEFGMGSLGTNVVAGKRPTKNPQAFLPPSSSARGVDKEWILQALQQSPEQILESHQRLLDHCIMDGSHDDELPHYSAGGSSCGAAASVAHGSCLVALASDTGGSIRLPAAWCGVVGLKTSYGRVPRHGLVSYASSLDTVGFLTPTVNCASLMLTEAIQPMERRYRQEPPMDSTAAWYSSSAAAVVGRETAATAADKAYSNNETRSNQASSTSSLPLDGIRIGIPAAFMVTECCEEMRAVWQQGAAALEAAGASVSTIPQEALSPEIVQASLAAYYVLVSAEASSNLARYDGFRYGMDNNNSHESGVGESSFPSSLLHQQYATTRTNGFGPDVIRRILCGTSVLSSDRFHTHYEAAAKLRAVLTQQLEQILSSNRHADATVNEDHAVDYLLIPTALSPPPSLTKHGAPVDTTAMFANDIMTVPISLAGLAAVGVPRRRSGLSSRVETMAGLQLVGRRWDEEGLLCVAQHLEGVGST